MSWLSYGLELVCEQQVRAELRALGCVARAVDEMRALWSSNPERDAPRLLPYLLTQLAVGENSASRTRLGWAALLAPAPDWSVIRQSLAEAGAVAAIEAQLERWMQLALELELSEAPRAALEAHLARTRALAREALASTAIWRLAPLSRWAPGAVELELERSIEQAVAGMQLDERFCEAWEVQRWGAWCAQPRIARFFPVGLCLLGLAKAGVDVGERARELLERERCPDGFRYYGAWTGIPPDADDLGLALQLVAASSSSARALGQLEHAVQLLFINTQPDGWINTYFEQGLLEQAEADAPSWLVGRCSAVAANALIGLLDSAWPAPPGYLEGALGRTLEVFEDEGFASVVAYPRCYARLLFARLERSLAGRTELDAGLRARLSALLDALEREILSSQELDGGWGSPLATACHLAVLCVRGCSSFDPSPAILYLCTRQEPDGLWPREPLYHCPGRDHTQHDHGSRLVSAGICLAALADARGHLRRSAADRMSSGFSQRGK